MTKTHFWHVHISRPTELPGPNLKVHQVMPTLCECMNPLNVNPLECSDTIEMACHTAVPTCSAYIRF